MPLLPDSPCKFGAKIIVTGLVKCDRWGFGLNWGWQRNRLADLERILMLLDGKPVPDNRADVTRRLGDHIHKNRHSNRYDIIARHYPGMLPTQQ